MQENRTGAAIRRRGIKRIMRDQDHFITDLTVEQTLSAGIPRLLIDDVNGAACLAQPLRSGRRNREILVGTGGVGHDSMVTSLEQ